MLKTNETVYYCKECLYPSSHPLGLLFDKNGVCSGCRVHKEKYKINWNLKKKEFSKLLLNYKKKNFYDCVVPISGGKDSFFILDLVVNTYKLNPLLVVFNRHFNSKLGIKNLELIRSIYGTDIFIYTINQDFYRFLIKTSLKKIGSIYWPYICGSTVLPVQVACRENIPLIIWGCHQGIDQVGMFSHFDNIEMSRRYRKEHDLLGLEPEDLKSYELGKYKDDIKMLYYPSDDEIQKKGIRGVYLNNYHFWDSLNQHRLQYKKNKYYINRVNNTYDYFNDIDCQIYNKLHDTIKFFKNGYSKITDHVCREIRLKRISREQGIQLVNFYEKKIKLNDDFFFKWLLLNKNKFYEYLKKFKSDLIYFDGKKIKLTNESKRKRNGNKTRNTSNRNINYIKFNAPKILDKSYDLLLQGNLSKR